MTSSRLDITTPHPQLLGAMDPWPPIPQQPPSLGPAAQVPTATESSQPQGAKRARSFDAAGLLVDHQNHHLNHHNHVDPGMPPQGTFDDAFGAYSVAGRNASAPDELLRLYSVEALLQPAPLGIGGVNGNSSGGLNTFGNNNSHSSNNNNSVPSQHLDNGQNPASLMDKQLPSQNLRPYGDLRFDFTPSNVPWDAAHYSMSRTTSPMVHSTTATAAPATPATPGIAGLMECINNAQERAPTHPVKRRRIGSLGGMNGTPTGNGLEVDVGAVVLKQPAPPEAVPSQPQSQPLLLLQQHHQPEAQLQPQLKLELQLPKPIGAAQQLAGATIDLTNDDDNGPRPPPKDPKMEEVCLGMISVSIKCSMVPSPKPGQTSAVFGDSYWPAIKIVLSRRDGDNTPRIMAKDYTRTDVGEVDGATCSCLAPLMDASGVGFRTEARIPSRPKRPGEEPGKPVPPHRVPLEIVLYSRLGFARTIGRHLLAHHLRLTVPPMVPRGARLFNPQEHQPPPGRYAAPSGGSGLPSQASASASLSPSAPSSRTLEEIRNEVMNVFDSLAQNEELPEHEPSSLVLTPLLKHQKQGLHFLLAREQEAQATSKHIPSIWKPVSLPTGNVWRNIITMQDERRPPPPTRGGILADMMGLGKTLSILALLVGTSDAAARWAAETPTQPKAEAPRHPKTTSAAAVAAAAAAAAAKSAPLGLTKLVTNAKTTLLICPLSTVSNWEEQIKQHIEPGALRYHVYHGANRFKDLRKLAEFDLVITTYGSVSSELGSRSKHKSGLYPLEEIGWFRIVLDEAHMIREHNTLTFKAVYRLQANRRWAVTGTPVQNRLDDFAALLTFLRLRPFEDRTKFLRHIVDPFKSCDPEIVPKLRILVDTITLRRLKDKINLPPRTDEVIELDFSPEERHIYDLFAKNAKDRVKALAGPGIERALGGHTYIHILRSILRLRLLCAHGKDLLNEEDLNALQGMTADMAINLDDDDDRPSSGLTARQAYEMFRLMLDTNNDGCVGCGKKLGSNDNGGIDESESQEDVLGYMNPCFHVVCRPCHGPFAQRCHAAVPRGQTHGPCPVCSAPRQVFFVALHRSRVYAEPHGSARIRAAGGDSGGHNRHNRQMSKYGGPHTKTRALVNELLKNKIQSELNPGEPPFKSVVFSGWTSHLDLIQIALDDAGITYTRLDGSMARTARGQAMDTFRDDPGVQVILVSISAGGVGLNLTSGNSVFVMEPQFNPAAEAQAVDRVHRLGQKRPVRTVRFIMRNSFEEKMLELQDKKKKLASLSMDGKGRALDKADAARQKLMDLRSLFK